MSQLTDLMSASADPKRGASAVEAVLAGKEIPFGDSLGITESSSAVEPQSGATFLGEGDDDDVVVPDEYTDPVTHENLFDDDTPIEDDDDSLSDADIDMNGEDIASGKNSAKTTADSDEVPFWQPATKNTVADDDTASGASALHGNSPGFDDDEDSDDDDGDGGIRAKKSSKVKDLFSHPLQILEKHPTWKRPALFGAAALVVALIVMFAFGGNPGSETPKQDEPIVAQEEPESPAKEPTALMPKNVSASCPPGSTSPSLAFSGKPENAWRCGRANGIDGEIMNIKFDKPVCVASVTVMPGWNYISPNGTDHWNENRVVTQILWRLGGQQFIQKINPTRAGSTYTFPKCVTTSVMSMTIQKTERPSAVQNEGTNGGQGGDIIPPPLTNGDAASIDESKVDENVAVGSVTITGTES